MLFKFIVYSIFIEIIVARTLSENELNKKAMQSALTNINEQQFGADFGVEILKANGSFIELAPKSERIHLISNSNTHNHEIQDCPVVDNRKRLSQTELIKQLTNSSHYDRLERPMMSANENDEKEPVRIHARAYLYALQNLESSNLQFQVQGLLQMRFKDPRLSFRCLAPDRRDPILGQSQLKSLIWVPHIFLANERDSSVLGTSEKDVLTSISPDGTVIISSRVQATLFCWMDLRKFPFDEQECSTVLESWMYNSSELVLHWEKNSPLTFDPKMHLTEYVLQNAWTNESIAKADFNDLRHGAFIGNYSSLTFTVHLTREVGYYVMDYFLPSIMIVAISWVSFWLQADQTPARTTLGTSTLLTFITLASSLENNLPKVSYIKISEVWFLGCTAFIFGSLVEFAFVNTIWRRNRSLELKKINSKNILKSTLTPSMKRHKFNTNNIHGSNESTITSNNYLTVSTPIIITNYDSNDFTASNGSIATVNDNSSPPIENKDYPATMSPHEASLWIDRKARFVFPLAFIIFNAFFWTFVYCL